MKMSMTLTEVFDDLYDRVLANQAAINGMDGDYEEEDDFQEDEE